MMQKLTSRVAGDYGYIGVRMPSVTIPAGQEATLSATLWTGPKLQKEMAGYSTLPRPNC